MAAQVADAAPVDRLVARGLVARAGERLEVMACLRRTARITPRIAAAHATAALASGDAARLLAAADALYPSTSPSPTPTPTPTPSPITSSITSPITSPSDADLAVRQLDGRGGLDVVYGRLHAGAFTRQQRGAGGYTPWRVA
ncbi:MAG TPA: hypothetical protein VMZ28_28300, partial [Kofleriaceae bacterium]|nr:hypothetical protein [Kofleriaceae bacterium]